MEKMFNKKTAGQTGQTPLDVKLWLQQSVLQEPKPVSRCCFQEIKLHETGNYIQYLAWANGEIK